MPLVVAWALTGIAAGSSGKKSLVRAGIAGAVVLAIGAFAWRCPSTIRLVFVHAHNLVALAIWTGLLYVWHIPALYEAATFDSDIVHALQHMSFMLAGLAFWLSLLGPLPDWRTVFAAVRRVSAHSAMVGAVSPST